MNRELYKVCGSSTFCFALIWPVPSELTGHKLSSIYPCNFFKDRPHFSNGHYQCCALFLLFCWKSSWNSSDFLKATSRYMYYDKAGFAILPFLLLSYWLLFVTMANNIDADFLHWLLFHFLHTNYRVPGSLLCENWWCREWLVQMLVSTMHGCDDAFAMMSSVDTKSYQIANVLSVGILWFALSSSSSLFVS